MKASTVIIIVLGTVVVLGGAGGGAWFMLRAKDAKKADEPKPVEVDKREYKYISLDKVVVMLKPAAGDTDAHYVAIDIEFKALAESAEAVKEQLPLLRSSAVKLFSGVTAEEAKSASIDATTDKLNKAFAASYAAEHTTEPFTEAMIGKFIVE
jgi:flagellar FliL protein